MKLFITAIAAAAITFGAPIAANAKPVNCVFAANGAVKASGICDHQQRYNTKGDLVNDVTWPDGVRATHVYWQNGIAEIIVNGTVYTGLWSNDYAAGAPITVIRHTNGPATVIGGHVSW